MDILLEEKEQQEKQREQLDSRGLLKTRHDIIQPGPRFTKENIILWMKKLNAENTTHSPYSIAQLKINILLLNRKASLSGKNLDQLMIEHDNVLEKYPN